MTDAVDLSFLGDLADVPVEVAYGSRREDTNFSNYTEKFSKLINRLSKFRVGDKNGACLTQGNVISGRRLAKNVLRNTILMVDCDTGESLEEIQSKIEAAGLCAFIWTTYSHLKPYTHVAESKYLTWMRKSKRGTDVAVDPIEDTSVIREFLASTGKVKPSILDSITRVDRELADGGVRYVVHHDPMPRARALFLLKEPFDFTKGSSQDARIDEWKRKYADFSESLGLAYDRSCVDPSRLMYLPAHSRDDDPANHRLIWIDGERLDLESISRPVDELAAFSQAGSAHTTGKLHLKTPGLAAFLKQYGSEFNAAEFLRAHAGDDIRHDTTDKVECMCPNDDAHSNAGSPDDRAFFATDAISGNGWTMHCQHDSCIAESSEATGRPDRAWFLDLCCQKYGIENANELIAFTLNGEHEAQETPVNTGVFDALHERITALGENPVPTAVDDLVRDIALADMNVIMAEGLLRRLADASSYAIGTLRIALQGHRRAVQSALPSSSDDDDNTLGGFTRHPPPTDDEIRSRRPKNVYSYWTHKEQLRVAKAAFAIANKNDPRIFVKEEGGQVRVKKIGTNILLEDCGDGKVMWTSELNRLLTFIRVNAEGIEEEVPPWDSVVTEFSGSNDIELPIINGVSSVPVFAADGTLVTEEGYNEKTRVYLLPNCQYLAVPDVPTEAEVMEAFCFLLEPLRDFPFSDVFDGSADLPIRKSRDAEDPADRATDEDFDEDGFPYPNWTRGYVSRLHALSLILQPFMRDMIKGPTPIYHIDKSAPGTGAGYLINVSQIILTGSVAVSGTYNKNQEEFRKELFASLRRGAQSLIYDNINDKIDDPTFAQTLTSGILRGRILGQSTEIAVPIRASWIMAGNQMSFSGEMMRRICPIRMDADLPDPAVDRPPEFYKYQSLEQWVEDNRAQLVWCCHVLIRNWVAKGRPNSTGFILQSFSGWSHAMGGLFEAAGYDRFMDTAKAYIATRNEEKGTASIFVDKLWEKFEQRNWTIKEAYELGCEEEDGGGGGGLTSYGAREARWQYEDIPLNGANDHSRRVSLGNYVKKTLLGKTFRIGDVMVKLGSKKWGSNTLYTFRKM